MNKKQKVCLWVGIAVIVAMGLFPPWQPKPLTYIGWAYSFIVRAPEEHNGIDVITLCIQWFVVSVIAISLIYAFRERKPKDQQKQKTSKLAIASMLVGLLGIFSWIYWQLFWYTQSTLGVAIFSFTRVFRYLSMPIALILGIIAVYQIKAQKNRKQFLVLLGGIAALLLVTWQCYNFPMTDIPEVENTRIRLFIFLWVVIFSGTGYLIYTERKKTKKPKDEQKQ